MNAIYSGSDGNLYTTDAAGKPILVAVADPLYTYPNDLRPGSASNKREIVSRWNVVKDAAFDPDYEQRMADVAYGRTA